MYFRLLFVALFVDVYCVFINNDRFDDDEHGLHAKLFQNYEKTIRPVRSRRHKTNVQLATNLISIVKLVQSLVSVCSDLFQFRLHIQGKLRLNILLQDERNQELTVQQASIMRWTDEYLSWDGTEYSNSIPSIIVSSELVWKPDIMLTNGHQIVSTLPASQRYVRIYRNGVVEMFDSFTVTIGCQFVVADFPFDNQSCALEYNPWLHDNETVTLSIYKDYEKQTLLYLETNPEWEVLTFKATQGVDTVVSDSGAVRFYDNVSFTLSIKRRPYYFIITFVAPTFAITCVCLVGLFTPSNSDGPREEKVTLGLTTLLTMSVILNIVTDAMPRSGSGMPKLGNFIMIEMVVAACATLVTVVIMFLHQRAVTRAWPVPRLGKGKVSQLAQKETVSQSQLRTMSAKVHSVQQKEVSQALVSCFNSLESVRKHIESKLVSEKLAENWGRIFDNVDLVMSVLFFVVHVALSLATLRGVVL